MGTDCCNCESCFWNYDKIHVHAQGLFTAKTKQFTQQKNGMLIKDSSNMQFQNLQHNVLATTKCTDYLKHDPKWKQKNA